MGSFVSCWTVINIVSERCSGCNGPNVAALTAVQFNAFLMQQLWAANSEIV